MAGFILRLAGALPIVFALTAFVAVDDAFSHSELKLYITNKLPDEVKANLLKGEWVLIEPEQWRSLTQDDKHDTLHIRYKPDNGQCVVDMDIEVNSFGQGCHGKEFTPTKEEGCRLEKTECSGANDCKCYFNLKKK